VFQLLGSLKDLAIAASIIVGVIAITHTAFELFARRRLQ